MAELMYFLATYDYLSEEGYRAVALEGRAADHRFFGNHALTSLAGGLYGTSNEKALLPDDIDGYSERAIYNYLSDALGIFNQVASEIRDHGNITAFGRMD